MSIKTRVRVAARRLLERPSRKFRPQPAAFVPELTPLGTLGLATWFGLSAGLLELGCEVVRKLILGRKSWLGDEQLNNHYLWMIPACSLLVFGTTGCGLALLARWKPRPALRVGLYVLFFLLVLTLLFVIRSLHPVARVLLALGLSVRLVPHLLKVVPEVDLWRRRTLPYLAGFAIALAAFSFVREWVGERLAYASATQPPAGAPNVLLIVLDAVRPDALGTYGAARDTSPCLSKIARMGVRFANARATAPWTLPSHASMFTGRMPAEMSTGLTTSLDAKFPTLAEHLRDRGYATAGFAANYYFCTGNYGLARGFVHYEDRPCSLDDIVGSSSLGRRLYPTFDLLRYAIASRFFAGARLGRTDDEDLVTHRKTAAEINQAFLNWLPARGKRPFFAFLNYVAVHQCCVVSLRAVA